MAAAAEQEKRNRVEPITGNILRAFGSLSRVEEGDARKALFVASTEARDRHGTIIQLEAWKKRLSRFNSNGIIAYQHHTSSDWFDSEPFNPDYIIGSGRAYVEGSELMCEVTFQNSESNPLATKIWDKVQADILKAMSVGFLPHDGHWGDPDEGEDSGTFYFTDVELLECSIVNIPSNHEALKRDLSGWINEHHPKKDKPKNKDFSNQLAAARAQVEFFKTII